MSGRIPAWKRLGLKLKYTKEDPDPAELLRFQYSKQEQQVVGSLKSNGLDAKSRPTKRRRLNGDKSSQTQHPPSYINGHSQHEPSRQTDHDTRSPNTIAAGFRVNGQATHESASKKRKHVSFTRDENLGESDLRSNENIALDVSGSMATEANGKERDATTTAAPTSANDTSNLGGLKESSELNEATQQSKTKSKINKERRSQPSASGTKPTAALDYLSQHYEQRDLWKFNKNRDVWILNHAQDVKAIPRSYDLALAGYVHGLSEQAASRNRLLSECRTNLESTTSSITDSGRVEAKKAFLDALENVKPSTNSGNLSERMHKFPRSLLLLWALGVSDALATSTPRPNRKSRTSAPIEVSTSEGDDSSSSSSESSDDSDTKKIRKAGNGKEVLGRDAGSSNGSNSDDDTSSSGSDDDTSSDSD